jgi:lipopolysaccharide export system permease protein
MRILTRYILRAHVGPFFFALSVLTGLLFVNAVARRFEDLAGKGLPYSVILEFLYLSLPHIIALTLPMAVLVATLYAFSTLAAENEISAMKANGVGLIRVMVPLIVTAVLLAGFMVWFNDRVLPETNHRLKTLLMDVGRKNPTLTFRENAINPIRSLNLRTRYFLEPGAIDHVTGRMRDVVIYDLSTPQRMRTIYADSGRMAMNEAETNFFLALYDGYVVEVDEQKPENFQRVFFDEQLTELREIGAEFERGIAEAQRGDREMSLAMLSAVVDTARMELASLVDEAVGYNVKAVERVLAGPAGVPGEAPSMGGFIGRSASRYGDTPSLYYPMNTTSGDDVIDRAVSEMQMLQSRTNMIEFRINSNLVEWHKKFAIPFACIVFVLLGAPIAVRFPRGGPGMVIAVSLTIFGIYYVSLIGGETLGDKGTVPAHWGPWGPNLVFFAISLWALARLGKEASTSRGGGWEDLWFTLRGAFTLPWRRAARAADAPRETHG